MGLPSQIHDTPSSATRFEKGFVMIARMLAQGYGVEDISVKIGMPVNEVRFVVALMRDTGSLTILLKSSRLPKSNNVPEFLPRDKQDESPPD